MKMNIKQTKRIRLSALMLALLLATGAAQAEWLAVGRNESLRVYVDNKLIQRNGDLAQTWQLLDFTSARWADTFTVIWSIKTLVEYDCAQPRFRNLGGEAYSEQLGGGKMVGSEQIANPEWEAIEPNSTALQIRQIACGKK